MGDETRRRWLHCDDLAGIGADFVRADFARLASTATTDRLPRRRAELSHLRPGLDADLRCRLQLHLLLCTLHRHVR